MFSVVLPLVILIILFVVRLFYFYTYQRGQSCSQYSQETRGLMVILGSGGHTTEVLSVLEKLDAAKYKPVVFVLAETDKTSELRARVMRGFKEEQDKYVKIPRSREVHQSWLSTVWTTICSIFAALPIILREKPDMILCNGPGTCVPICLIAWILTIFGYHRTVITFVESICRVKTLSLTGKILYYFVDVFFVQYEELAAKYSWSVYLGRLV